MIPGIRDFLSEPLAGSFESGPMLLVVIVDFIIMALVRFKSLGCELSDCNER